LSEPVLGGRIDKAVVTAMNALASRQRVISNNLANIDTPGFKAADVQFEEQLQNAMSQDTTKSAPLQLRPVGHTPGQIAVEVNGSSALDSVEAKIVRPEDTELRLDGNNVDIDKEMIALAETTISYNSMVQIMAARVAMARYAVNEGRR